MEDAGQVDEREQVHDPEAAPAAAQRGGEVEPAQVAVAEDPAERRPDGPAREGRRTVGAALAHEEQDEDRDGDGRQPERDRGAPPAVDRDDRDADERHDHGPDVATGDVRADGETAPFGRELLGQQPVADRVLGRATDARRDVRDGEGREAVGERLEREPATEQDPADGEQATPRDDPRQGGVAELDHPRGEGPERGEERDRLHADAELVDDLEEDQGQDDGLSVVDRVRHREQPERTIWVDLLVGHPRMVPHRWLTNVGQPSAGAASAALCY